MNITNATCSGEGTAIVSGAGGTGTYTFSWSNGTDSGNFSEEISLPFGVYTFFGTDQNGCTASVAKTISQGITHGNASH